MKLPPQYEWVAMDSEFRAGEGSPEVRCICCVNLTSGEPFRHWHTPGGEPPRFPFDLSRTVLVTFQGLAEATSLLAVGSRLPAGLVDLFVEQKMIDNLVREKNVRVAAKGLLATLLEYGFSPMETTRKQHMRALILARDEFTDKERDEILAYCLEDTSFTGRLFFKMRPHFALGHAMARGNYVLACAAQEQRGIPWDSKLYRDFQERLPQLEDHLKGELHKATGVVEKGKIKQHLYEKFISETGLAVPRTPTGKVSHSREKLTPFRGADDRLDQFLHYTGLLDQLKLFKPAAKFDWKKHPPENHEDFFKELNKRKYLGLRLKDGRARVDFKPFWTQTSRNAPSNKQFPFLAAKWTRFFVKPPPGRSLAYLDYEAQEIGVLGALTDQHIWEDYCAGDFYFNFAKRAKLCKPDESFDKFKASGLRKKCKVVCLGVNYGQGVGGISRTLRVMEYEAEDMVEAHRAAYRSYWEFRDRLAYRFRRDGHLATNLGWHLHHSPRHNPNSALNFLIQANSAEITRMACWRCEEEGLEVLFSLHDALCVEAPTDEIDDAAGRAVRVMEAAARKVIGRPLRVSVDKHHGRFRDEDGEPTWREFLGILGLEDGEGVSCTG